MFLTVFYEGDNRVHVMKIKLYGMKTDTLVNAESELSRFVNNKKVTKSNSKSMKRPIIGQIYSDVLKLAQTRNVVLNGFLGRWALTGGAYDVQLVEDYVIKHS